MKGVIGLQATCSFVGRDIVEGAAVGAVFMALFGAVWAFVGAVAVGGTVGVLLLCGAVVLAVTLCLGSIRVRRAVGGLPRDDSPLADARRKHLSNRLSLVSALQGVAIVLAVILLGRYALAPFIPAVVVLIVGVHFFPLAKLYAVRAYYVTGSALCALAAVAFLVAPAWRLPFVGLACAAVLFATAAYVLCLVGEEARYDEHAA